MEWNIFWMTEPSTKMILVFIGLLFIQQAYSLPENKCKYI